MFMLTVFHVQIIVALPLLDNDRQPANSSLPVACLLAPFVIAGYGPACVGVIVVSIIE